MSDRRVYSLQSRGGLLTLQVALGSSESGSKVVRLLIDTGSNFTTLPVDLLDEIGCDLRNPVRRVSITTANGIVRLPVVEVPWFSCLGQRTEMYSVVALNLPPTTVVDGLLGMDFLRQCDVLIDVKRSRILVAE